MHLLPEENPNAPQLLLIFTLQVSLSKSFTQYGLSVAIQPALILLKHTHTCPSEHSVQVHIKTDHITPTFLHPLSQPLLQKSSASHKAGEKIYPQEPHYAQLLALGGMKTQP